jgi:hypothetical protein
MELSTDMWAKFKFEERLKLRLGMNITTFIV